MYKAVESPIEGWFIIPGVEYFYAARDGSLRNVKTGYVTFGSLDDKGYMRACIWDNDKKSKKDVKVHYLICTAFNGRCNKGEEVGHKNDIRDDNRAVNLKWVTRKENMTKANSKRKSKTLNW